MPLLDLTGIWRKKGSVDDVVDVRKVLDGQPDQQRALRAPYGGDEWRGALRPDASLAENLEEEATPAS